MQLRRAVPLSLLALLASAGCVSVGPGAPDPARGSVPPVGAPDTAGVPGGAVLPGDSGPLPALSVPLPLPLGDLPGSGPESGPGAEPDPSRPLAKGGRPPSERRAKPAVPPRRVRPARPAAPRVPRPQGRLPRVDELCAAAEGSAPPSIVDLCVHQYGQPTL
ncbi:hypothetical protein ACIQF5_01370 [Streptomyces goshikiensis]|uniref:hypothetical protein n=1 Tax=Streptomyces goshikiensis TaxID=1942 RepID=UPI0037FEE55C